MALELLAGPFNVRDADGTAVDITQAQFYPTAIYDDVIGLASSGSGSYCTTQMDGVTYTRAKGSFGFGGTSAGAFILDLQSNEDWIVRDTLFNNALYAFDRKTGALGSLIIDGATNAVVDVQARAADRYLSFVNSTAKSRPLDLSSAFATECTFVGYGSGRASLSRTRHANILCVAWPSGQVLYYDYVNRVQADGAAFIGANYGAWYSPLHDVFVALTGTSTNQISVYANSVLPTAISNPVASPALAQGRKSAISVTITGAQGDPSAGELVDWVLDGPGSLVSTQSETDASGVATVAYITPLALSTNPTFTATVTL